MSGPFSALPAGVPLELVVEMLDPAITQAHARIRSLGDTISGAGEVTRQAMVAALESAEHEVAVAALLSGANAIMLGYRVVSEQLGASLCAQLDAAQAAWRAYCTSGDWEPPGHAAPSQACAPQLSVQLACPRLLGADEYITAGYTEEVIGTTAKVATNVGKAGRDFLSNILRAPTPSGELTEFVNNTTTEHAQTFATLQTALAESLHDFIVSIQASCENYRQNGQWANPTVILT